MKISVLKKIRSNIFKSFRHLHLYCEKSSTGKIRQYHFNVSISYAAENILSIKFLVLLEKF